MKTFLLLLLLTLATGCAPLARHALDDRYGAADPARFDAPLAPQPGKTSFKEIRPILDRRCVVCHACYDAPCQAKLSAWEGVVRGGSKVEVYDGARLLDTTPTRLFIDAQAASGWRAMDFHPILNERDQTPQANLAGSVLYRMLDLKHRHPLPGDKVLPKSFDFSLDRAQQCANIESFDSYERNYPLWGMPYGLPGLNDQERARLASWLEQGAAYAEPEPMPPAVLQQVQEWESFLNGDTLKERLVSRYLYEHLFLAHLHFDSDPARHYFRLIRSTTPPGQPARVVSTRRPTDDPGVERVYYRLEPELETPVVKTHMPYALGSDRMARWKALFMKPDYSVQVLPSYAPEVTANPFQAFQALSADARYRFMLDEAEFTIMGFIKGPVCRGQLALDVIEDQFWVFFMDPDKASQEAEAAFLAKERDNLDLPAEAGSNAAILTPWLKYSRKEMRYLQAKANFMDQAFGASSKAGLDLVWDGNGVNSNAALTVFRNFNNAAVVKGLVGTPPKTSWVLGYPLLERIHYLLVAGYDVFGNTGEQLNTRLYMDFLRMEGELNFTLLLPQETRESVLDFWYRDANRTARNFLSESNRWFNPALGIDYRNADPQQALYGMLRQRLAPVLGTTFDLSIVQDVALRSELQGLAGIRGRSLSWIPEASFLRLDDPTGRSRYFTLLRNTGHSNVSHLIAEKEELLPEENTLTVAPGFIGAYPNALYAMPEAALPRFSAAIRGLASEDDYRVLADQFAIRRTHPQFWSYSDALQDAYIDWPQSGGGLFDYNRLENR